MIKYLFIGAILSIILVSGCINQTGPQVKPCEWVFKTDPTNIGHMSGTLNSGRTMIVQYGDEPDPIVELNNSYFTMTAGCAKDFPYTNPSNFVFFKATTLEEFRTYDVTGDNVDSSALSAAIKDDNPFSELYFCEPCLQTDLFEGSCDVTKRTEIINTIVDIGELDSRCDRII